MYLYRQGSFSTYGKYNEDAVTCARKPIASVSCVARAGVTSWTVVASRIVMTVIIAYSTFIHICSSKVVILTEHAAAEFLTHEINVIGKNMGIVSSHITSYVSLAFAICRKKPSKGHHG